MKYYKLEITPGVNEAGSNAFFRYTPCAVCGEPRRMQIADLILSLDVEVGRPPQLIVAPGGELVMERTVWKKLAAAGAQGETRSAAILGVEATWVQVSPTCHVALTPLSLRAPYQSCDTCGGTALPTFDRHWEVESQGEDGPVLASILGASQLKVFSEVVRPLLEAEVPTLVFSPLFPTSVEWEEPVDWGDV